MNKSAKISFYLFSAFLVILIPIKSLAFVNGYDFSESLYVTNNLFYILFKIILFLSIIGIALPVFLDKRIEMQFIDSDKLHLGFLNLVYGISFLYDAFVNLMDITSKVNNSLLDFGIVIFGIISGICILIYGFLIIFKKSYNTSAIWLLIPLIYYTIILLKQFLYTQIKTYFDDGIFLIFRDICVLLFLISLIKNIFGNGSKKNFKLMIVFGLVGVLLNIILIFNGNFFSGKYFEAMNYVGISNIILSLYILVYIVEYIFISETDNFNYIVGTKTNNTIDLQKLDEFLEQFNDIDNDVSDEEIVDNIEEVSENTHNKQKLDKFQVEKTLDYLEQKTLELELNIQSEKTKHFEIKTSNKIQTNNICIKNISEQNKAINKEIDVDKLNERIDSLLDYFS